MWNWPFASVLQCASSAAEHSVFWQARSRTQALEMRLASTYLLVVAARAFVPPVQQPVAARTTRLRAQEEATLGTAVRNIAVWLPLFLVEPALPIPNYKECVAEKGHEACANLLPFFQWLYEHGIDVAA